MNQRRREVFDLPGWWRQAVVYQIYPRSFADANADGIGDLAGITSRVDYLRDLGIDAVWLSPFYPSALADGGYDVDDYRNVDPKIGTLDEFDEMVAALHAAHIKVVVDIVPNHSSNRHKWFRAALNSPKGSNERSRYIFRDGKGENGELHGELDPHEVPLNFLDPRPGTPFGHMEVMDGKDALRAIGMFRLAMPATTLRFAGGRELTLGDMGVEQGLTGGINGIIVGNYLTTLGRPAEQDMDMMDRMRLPIKVLSRSV